MENEQKTMPRSFRVSEDTMEKFKAISTAIEGNQEETLAKLIQVYELQGNKQAFPEKKEDIEKFESYMNVMIDMYMKAVESGADAKVIARAEYQKLLESKDQQIVELQERVSKAESIATKYQDMELDYIKNMDEKKVQVEALNKENSELKDKYEELNSKELQWRTLIETVSAERNELEKTSKTNVELFIAEQEKNQMLMGMNDKLEKEIESLKSKIDELQAASEVKVQDAVAVVKEQEEVKREKAIIEKEKEMMAAYEASISKYREEADKYRDMYYKLKEDVK